MRASAVVAAIAEVGSGSSRASETLRSSAAPAASRSPRANAPSPDEPLGLTGEPRVGETLCQVARLERIPPDRVWLAGTEFHETAFDERARPERIGSMSSWASTAPR